MQLALPNFDSFDSDQLQEYAARELGIMRNEAEMAAGISATAFSRAWAVGKARGGKVMRGTHVAGGRVEADGALPLQQCAEGVGHRQRSGSFLQLRQLSGLLGGLGRGPSRGSSAAIVEHCNQCR